MNKEIHEVINKTNSKKKIMTTKNTITWKNIILSLIISIFTVVFLWWFFTNWIYALGINMSILWLLISWLFLQGTRNIWDLIKDNVYWIVPILWIIISFSLYENPFLKTINIFLLPLLLTFFFSYTKIKIEWNKRLSGPPIIGQGVK